MWTAVTAVQDLLDVSELVRPPQKVPKRLKSNFITPPRFSSLLFRERSPTANAISTHCWASVNSCAIFPLSSKNSLSSTEVEDRGYALAPLSCERGQNALSRLPPPETLFKLRPCLVLKIKYGGGRSEILKNKEKPALS